MQIDSLLILNSNREILYCTHAIRLPKGWPEYQDHIVKLLGSTIKTSFSVFDDVAIGTTIAGQLTIIVTAPLTSPLIVDANMSNVLKHFVLVLQNVCQGEISQANLMQRDHIIRLQMILQEEFSPSGYFRMLSEDELTAVSSK